MQSRSFYQHRSDRGRVAGEGSARPDSGSAPLCVLLHRPKARAKLDGQVPSPNTLRPIRITRTNPVDRHIDTDALLERDGAAGDGLAPSRNSCMTVEPLLICCPLESSIGVLPLAQKRGLMLTRDWR